MGKIRSKQKKTLAVSLPLVEAYVKANSEQRKKALMKMNNKGIKMLCECCLNVLFNDDIVKKTCSKKWGKCRKQLEPYKCHLCTLAVGKLKDKDRRILAIYMRNCIGVLLKLLLPSLHATVK